MNKVQQAVKSAMLKKMSAERDIPKYVQDKAEYFEKEKDYEPGYAFSTAWSIYCKYKNPGDKEHCTKDPSEYFKGKSKKASSVKGAMIDSILDHIEQLERASRLSLDDEGYLFEMVQDYIMRSFNLKDKVLLEKYLKTLGVPNNMVDNFLKKIQIEFQY